MLIVHLCIFLGKMSIKVLCPFLLSFLRIYLWLHWVFVAAHGLSLVAASRKSLSSELGALLIAVVSLAAEPGLWVLGLE